MALELIETARAAGLVIRELSASREDPQPHSGFVLLRGQPTLFLETGLPAEEQIAVVARALKSANLENVFLSPAVRGLLEEIGETGK